MSVDTPKAPTAGSTPVNPVLIEAVRADVVENIYRGAFAVVDAEGRVRAAQGDIHRPVFPRSAAKPLQALALVESGAADAFALRPREIALACASHSGEDIHVEAVQAWLKSLGLGADDLECGVMEPFDPAVARELCVRGEPVTTFHHMCSGKHSGFLTLAKHLGVPTQGYIKADHPVQKRVRAVIEEMSAERVTSHVCATDGCGIPTFALPLGAFATALARLARPARDTAAERADACRRIREAMAVHPDLVGGRGRFDTRAMRATRGRVLLKSGAEGVYAMIVPEAGLGVALKIDDGDKRASEMAAANLLRALGLLDGPARDALKDDLLCPWRNVAGKRVGVFRPVDDRFAISL